MRSFRAFLFLAITQLTACTVVDSGFVGVKTKWGEVQPDALGEGFYLNWPGHDVILLDARLLKLEVEASASSRDLQAVASTVALNYQIVSAQAPSIFQRIGTIEAVENNLITPILQEAIKMTTAGYDAAQLIQNRNDVTQKIFDSCKDRLVSNQIIVTNVSILNFAFNAEYQQAIERKQVAQQTAEAALNDLQRIEVEAKQAEAKARGEANALLIQAEAEAKRQKLLGETMTDKLVEWKAIEKWDGRLPTVQAGERSLIQIPLQ